MLSRHYCHYAGNYTGGEAEGCQLWICIFNPPGSGDYLLDLDLVSHSRDSLISLMQRIHFWCSSGEEERQLPSCERKANDSRDLTTSYNQSFLSSPCYHPLPVYLVTQFMGLRSTVQRKLDLLSAVPTADLELSLSGLQVSFHLTVYALPSKVLPLHFQLVILCLKIRLFCVVSVEFWKKQD